ncbi:OsmC family protein [Marisediminicola sp. LYQ85]|uniref:OsmC family protein n=1 Tax=Marisediminicola sp. LYQ85 TaxID=3391062 RepID=UPI00398398D5
MSLLDPDHHYRLDLEWTGDRGVGTTGYRSYGRDHVLRAVGKSDIAGSSDRVFHGDADRWNPEELLIAALSQCHLLSYLHVATNHGLVVVGYRDSPEGLMRQDDSGGGAFVSVTLRPVVTVATLAGVDAADARRLARSLHAEAASKCFIAASVAFPVHHEPETVVAAASH